MPDDTIFARIVRGEVPAHILYSDDLVTAFRDVNPQAPVHVLIVPNETVPSVREAEADHEAALGRMFTVAGRLARDLGIDDDGYRLIVNTGDHAGQEVHHLHMHLLGGLELGPMLAR